MKKDLHPEYHQTTATCACGNEFKTGSTLEDIRVEICSNCHPFFTGKQKLIDTARRVDRFEAMQKKAADMKKKRATAKKGKKVAKPKKKQEA